MRVIDISEVTNPCTGWNAAPCNGPLRNYNALFRDVSQQERANNYMAGKDREFDVVPLYPWRRNIIAEFSGPEYYAQTAYDLCTRPKGKIVPGVTKTGVGLYKAPINGLPPYNNNKCYECQTFGKNCLNCEGSNDYRKPAPCNQY